MTQVTYITKNHRDLYKFKFVNLGGGRVGIQCIKGPSFNGKIRSVEHSHVYSSGMICFVRGHEPKSVDDAKSRAGEWAEYFSRYRRTGRTEH